MLSNTGSYGREIPTEKEERNSKNLGQQVSGNALDDQMDHFLGCASEPTIKTPVWVYLELFKKKKLKVNISPHIPGTLFWSSLYFLLVGPKHSCCCSALHCFSISLNNQSKAKLASVLPAYCYVAAPRNPMVVAQCTNFVFSYLPFEVCQIDSVLWRSTRDNRIHHSKTSNMESFKSKQNMHISITLTPSITITSYKMYLQKRTVAAVTPAKPLC